MGKSSSSSLKKKRSKKSSKVQSRKISKTRSRKSKLKKLRRREDSVSCSSSDDDSRSLLSSSSYSSEDDYRSRRARSHTRKDAKSGKKRARRRSSSRDSSEDSRRVSKKKGSKRSDGSRGRKRTHQKKKRKARRDASVSSMSSGSSCRYDNSSYDESEYERQKESERNVDKIRTERYTSPTLYSQHAEHSDRWIEEKVTSENNSRRLRSVITVIKKENVSMELDNEEHKEEIVYDHDDYPSSRSNDSNDGGSKRESGYNSSFESEKKIPEEIEKEGAVVSISRSIEIAETGKEGSSRCSEVLGATGGPDGEDLESVLRRKALENLKKFRGGIDTNDKDNAGKQTTTIKVESIQKKPQGNSSGAVNVAEIAVADNLEEKVNAAATSATDQSKSDAALSRLNLSKSPTTLKQACVSQKTSNENLVSFSSEDKISGGDAQVVSGISCKDGEEVNPKVCDSSTLQPPSLKSPSEAITSNEPQDEAKDSSQYEQKTMSVMRGGEMVQVSYKVYIPKKTPALARRHLKR